MEKDKKPLISVIIPIYKAEKYITKCVESVLAQTYENLELILVDDGSPDKSGSICDAFAKKDARISVIHKENGGAATARNAGLDVMSGQYVAFVDADDYMEKTYLETLYDTLSKQKAQVALCSFQIVDEEGRPVFIDSLHEENSSAVENDGKRAQKPENIRKETVVTGNEIILQGLRGHWEHVAPWGKLYEAGLFEGVRYPHWMAYEDEHVFIQIFDKTDIVAIGTEKLYFYVQHSGSLMNTAYSEKQRATILHMWQKRIVYYSDNNPKHKELLNCVLQAYLAWDVLFLAQHGEKMTKIEKKELKKEISRYFGCFFQTPHLYSGKESMKLAVKCVLTFISTDILGRRYTG